MTSVRCRRDAYETPVRRVGGAGTTPMGRWKNEYAASIRRACDTGMTTGDAGRTTADT